MPQETPTQATRRRTPQRRHDFAHELQCGAPVAAGGMHHRAEVVQAPRQRPAPEQRLRVELRRRRALEVLEALRQEAVARDREHARVRTPVRDREHHVHHREARADEQHARHVGRQLLDPLQVPGVLHRMQHTGSGPAAGELPVVTITRIRLDDRAVHQLDARTAVRDIDARRARAQPLETEPARAAASRKVEALGEVVAVPGARQEIAAAYHRVTPCAHCRKSFGRSGKADIRSAGTLRRQ